VISPGPFSPIFYNTVKPDKHDTYPKKQTCFSCYVIDGLILAYRLNHEGWQRGI